MSKRCERYIHDAISTSSELVLYVKKEKREHRDEMTDFETHCCECE